jgi:DNA-binding NarL/FixJ family response regulator
VILMRILLADTQPKVRFALRVLLEQQLGLEVVGEVATSEGVLAETANLRPDLVLLDWGLAGISAAVLLHALRSGCPGVVVIGLSGRPGVRREVLSAGADDFVSKGEPPEHLLAAIARCCPEGETASADLGVCQERGETWQKTRFTWRT